ncbi:extracellular endo-alpha-(1-_5)-L-arabinanase 1 (plasmid) [Deinococcus aetherius]|uniref:Extracellular endo-alpha-(1->5)-L-arabinanase 1 n=1 Tax=Deinococcus aetherius TaxID=200252 RepID=A0ABM8AK27_9DEIO|nr:arabinan endo-1,5-alpha-L-arabinosidase [Deinococcus aetherius]BDP44176.1 extracellular endo-alpha-(1->5)-L-arabinanase 1 [Deinococcus aetherius]
MKPKTVALLVLSGLLSSCTRLGSTPSDGGPALLTLTGELDAHDPTLFKAGNTYYVFSTGLIQTEADPGGIRVRSAPSLNGEWKVQGAITAPEWAKNGYHANNLWAPNVVKNGDTYYLYYAVSEFGKNHSAIGLATTTTPGDLGSWQDQGPILTSNTTDDFNAIDPHVFNDGGQWWISYGSFWSGLKLQKLQDMKTPTGDRVALADRPGVQYNPIEGPAITKHGSYYYLFMSWDFCCQGRNTTYKLAVGRSTSVTGPYVDRTGKALTEGGGTVLLTGQGSLVGAGGEDVYTEGGNTHLIYHSYDANQNYLPTMSIRRLGWSGDWPTVE